MNYLYMLLPIILTINNQTKNSVDLEYNFSYTIKKIAEPAINQINKSNHNFFSFNNPLFLALLALLGGLGLLLLLFLLLRRKKKEDEEEEEDVNQNMDI